MIEEEYKKKQISNSYEISPPYEIFNSKEIKTVSWEKLIDFEEINEWREEYPRDVFIARLIFNGKKRN